MQQARANGVWKAGPDSEMRYDTDCTSRNNEIVFGERESLSFHCLSFSSISRDPTRLHFPQLSKHYRHEDYNYKLDVCVHENVLRKICRSGAASTNAGHRWSR